MPKINPDRLLGDLYRLREFGAYKTGVHRPTYAPDDIASRHWLAARMAEAGLDASIDGIGNVIGRAPGPGPKLLIGSHSETQPYAGWLDGALGVIYGLEVARALSEDPACAGLGVDVAAWADEEGHYKSFIGSRSFIGDLTEDEIDGIANQHDGTPLRTALAAAGLKDKPRIQVEPGRHIGFMEAHIEQGDSLEARGLKLGVVASIVAIWQFRITATGIQNHAGTTRMAIRKDAGLALARLAVAIDERFPAVKAPLSVWTVGDIDLEPGFGSIIPGKATMLFQFRDVDKAQLLRFERTLEALIKAANAAGPCALELETVFKTEPMAMAEAIQAALDQGSEAHAPGLHVRMPSGAGHDAQVLAGIMPAGMLFIPSIGGVSHHWTENTADADIVTGAAAMADAAAILLKAAAKA